VKHRDEKCSQTAEAHFRRANQSGGIAMADATDTNLRR
jgi:hypothetical protein